MDEVSPGVMRATGDDSIVALYETSSGIFIQLCYLPSGPGRRWVQRTVHGRRGSMAVPPDRSGGAVVVQLGDIKLSGSELRNELGFAGAVLGHRSPEVDGLAGLRAVAGVWAVAESRASGASLRIADVADGTICKAQAPVDAALGFIGGETGGQP